MLYASLVISLPESLAQAIRHTEVVTHRPVLQDAIQNIWHPRSHIHPALVIAMLRDTLARHDHKDLNSFSRIIGSHVYRVGFVLGWLTAVIDQGMAPVHQVIPSVARCAPGAMR
jgi:hypothetical protein